VNESVYVRKLYIVSLQIEDCHTCVYHCVHIFPLILSPLDIFSIFFFGRKNT